MPKQNFGIENLRTISKNDFAEILENLHIHFLNSEFTYQKEPMLLLTNHVLTCEPMGLYVFHLYLKRRKIEGVFKFLKEHLGWENFQVRDFQSIENVIVLCYFIGGYFYEMEDELTKNPLIQRLLSSSPKSCFFAIRKKFVALLFLPTKVIL